MSTLFLIRVKTVIVLPRLALFWDFKFAVVKTPLARLHIFLYLVRRVYRAVKAHYDRVGTTAPPSSENSLRQFLLDMKSDLMQHVQDCVSNAMQDFVRDDVASEFSDDLCDDHSNPRVSDEIDHFLAQNVGQYSAETQAEASRDLKDLAAEFSTNERTSSSIDDDLLKIIEGLVDNKLPNEKIDGLTEKYPRPENCNLFVVPKTNRAVWNQLKDATKKADIGMQKC